MEKLDTVMREEPQTEINPFEIQTDGPLNNQVPVGKRAPKRTDPTDVGGFGGLGGG